MIRTIPFNSETSLRIRSREKTELPSHERKPYFDQNQLLRLFNDGSDNTALLSWFLLKIRSVRILAPGLMFDDFLPTPDAESLPVYPLVLKLVVCMFHALPIEFWRWSPLLRNNIAFSVCKPSLPVSSWLLCIFLLHNLGWRLQIPGSA